MRRLIIIFMLLCFVQQVVAQADCPAIVDAAFAATNDVCVGIERNQACYGNLLLDATPRADVAEFEFEQTGDIVDVVDIDSLQLSSMSLADETWGIALMLLQANLPDTLPGQNVTVLLFGDVSITNAAAIITEFEVTANANVNVRLRPTTNANNVIASLISGETVTANGRLEDGSWIRVVLDSETQAVGWVSADLVSSEGQLDSLTIVAADDAVVYAPMQTFYFASSIGDSQCAEAPSSGILIQTPQGAGEINLRVNEVDIRLGSTVYMTAGGNVMTVYVVEGHAVLSSNGVSQTVPAGTYAEIPVDSSGLADGAPTFPQPYNIADVQSLPVSVSLPQNVSVAPPVEEEDIEAAIDIADGLPPSGTWVLTGIYVEESNCEISNLGTSVSFNVIFTFSEDRETVTDSDTANPGSGFTLQRTGDNHYVGLSQFDFGHSIANYVFTSPTTMTFSSDFTGIGGDCTSRLEGTGTYAG